ncbi:hypothetical protein LCGC14_0141800 [marine sediment metagenome]|uniref:Single-stranded DNA-binding protein n=1 Tax=marine sediment metagenome TaxID=412755 RepID=A0A0F9V135_9ZZZZ
MAELMVVGVGVAAGDPELRYVGSKNTPVCTINLAFNRSYKKQDGDYEKEVCFLRGQIWGTRAEKMAEIVKSGQPVYVTGYMKQDKWEKDGQKRTAHSMNIRDFQLVEKNGHKKSDVPTKSETSQPKPESEPKPESVPVPDVDDSEIPF